MNKIERVAKENIDDILLKPEVFVNESFDKPLVKILGDNPTWILIGQNEDDGRYYLVVEDDETSQDYYPENNQKLAQLFINILKEELLCNAMNLQKRLG